MSTPNYLQRTKNGWFRYRRAIPVDVRKQYKRDVYIVSFRTQDIAEAKRQANLESVKFDAMVEGMRKSLERRANGLLRSDDIDGVCARFEGMLLHSDEVQRKYKSGDMEEMREHKALILEGVQQTSDAAYGCDASDYVDDYKAFLDTEGLRINEKWGHFQPFVLKMLDAQHRAYLALAERIGGKQVPTPSIPERATEHRNTDSIEKIVATWKTKQGIPEKACIEIDSCVRRLNEFAKIRHVSEIGETLPADFRDYLLAHGRVNKVKPGQLGGPLEVATVKKLIRLLSAAFQSAVDDKRLKKNPLVGLKFPKGHGALKIQRFSVEQLNQIFSSPVYTESYRPVGGAGEAAFWLPLFGIFCGGRETELAQPFVDDFGVENGYYFFEVTDKGVRADGTRQRVKNEESLRRVPLHPILIELGLLDYISWLKARGETEVFPNLNADCLGALTGNYSKWFARYLDNVVGIADRRWNFQSFRHSLKYYGRASNIPAELLDRLQGHVPENVGGFYGGDYPIQPLSEAMAMLSIPGLKLDHIHWTPPTGAEPTRLKRSVASVREPSRTALPAVPSTFAR